MIHIVHVPIKISFEQIPKYLWNSIGRLCKHIASTLLNSYLQRFQYGGFSNFSGASNNIVIKCSAIFLNFYYDRTPKNTQYF